MDVRHLFNKKISISDKKETHTAAGAFVSKAVGVAPEEVALASATPPVPLTLGSTQEVTSKDIIIERNLIDTLIDVGKRRDAPSLEPLKRNQFYKTHPELYSLLLRDRTNPLLRSEACLREGEYYLTHEAISLLVESKIEHYKTRKDANCKNIFIVPVNPTTKKLIALLNSLQLNPDEDAKFILIREIHASILYIRNINDKIQCFLLDSEPNDFGPTDIQEALKEVFGNPLIIINNNKMQFDFWSCNIFVIKALMYFIKHGSKVFEFYSAILECFDQLSGCYGVDEDQLIPSLLKLCQDKDILQKLSQKTLKAIVSKKSNKSLEEYLIENKVGVSKQTTNMAAFKKRYKYMGIINQQIAKLTKDKVPTDAWLTLPAPLAEIQKKFSSPVHIVKPTSFLDICEEVRARLTDAAKPLSPHARFLFLKLTSKLPTLEEDFHSTFKESKDSSPALQLIWLALVNESPVFNKEKEFAKFFYNKYLILLKDPNTIILFLKKHWPQRSLAPLKDLSGFDFPVGPYHAQKWGDLVLRFGEKAIKFLPFADKINPNILENLDLNNAITYYELLRKFVYLRHAENEELFELCVEYNKSDKAFNECLDSFAERPIKKFDILPAIEIKFLKDRSGKVTVAADDSKEFYYKFSKYPCNKLRGLFLGDEINCCQTIESEGQACAIDGMTSPFSGFYIVQDKRGRIIGITWVWIGLKGEFVFDSWELINQDQAHIFRCILDEAGKRAMKAGFSAVYIGEEGGTPQQFWDPVTKVAKPRLHYRGKTDAEKQLVIHPMCNEPLMTRVFSLLKEEKMIDPKIFQCKTPVEVVGKFALAMSQKTFSALVLFLYRNGCYILQMLEKHKLDLRAFTTHLDKDSQYLAEIPDNDGVLIKRPQMQNSQQSKPQ